MNLSGARALIVEDDRSWQQVLSEILIDAGLTVDVVDDLESAIASLQTSSHRLAVVDLSLGGSGYHNRDGLRVLDALRRRDPGCVTMLLSAFATVELAVSALNEYGALTCLPKEAFHRSRFRDLVTRALASAHPLEPIVHSPGDPYPGGPLTSKRDATSAPEPPLGLALVVEDDAGWRSILSELLTDAGYQVRLCGSFGEALGCLRREKYVLAVIDLSLANSTMADTNLWGRTRPAQSMDGYRLLASTRAGGTPTIVVTGVATPADIERAYAEHGIFACLEKQSFDRRAFLRTVDEAQSAGRNSGELDSLTRREREVLESLAQGLTNKEIAEALVITTNTVKRHLKAVFEKLEVHTRSAAAARAVSAGVTTEWPGADAQATD